MSGISILTNQKVPSVRLISGLMIFVLQFSLLSAAEKSVKVSVNKSKIETSESGTVFPLTRDINASSILQLQRQADYLKLSNTDQPYIEGTTKTRTRTTSKATKKRQGVSSSQAASNHLYFHSVGVRLNYDDDADGYYSDFTVDFDADTTYSSITVYASLYLSLNGGDWEHYYTTNNFVLNGTSSSDDFTVRTVLTSGFPPGNYDILIDLYDSYDNSLAATISADDTDVLAGYFLEDITFEDSLSFDSAFSIFSASITLLDDYDADGFYQSFSLQFDADVNAAQATVYADILVRDNSGQWQLDYTTDDFILDGRSTVDTYILETVLQSGYATGYYDFRVELFDATTNQLVATSSDQDYELSQVPLEDANADVQPSAPVDSTTPQTVSVGVGGAGSFGLLLLPLGLLGLRRKFS